MNACSRLTVRAKKCHEVPRRSFSRGRALLRSPAEPGDCKASARCCRMAICGRRRRRIIRSRSRSSSSSSSSILGVGACRGQRPQWRVSRMAPERGSNRSWACRLGGLLAEALHPRAQPCVDIHPHTRRSPPRMAPARLLRSTVCASRVQAHKSRPLTPRSTEVSVCHCGRIARRAHSALLEWRTTPIHRTSSLRLRTNSHEGCGIRQAIQRVSGQLRPAAT